MVVGVPEATMKLSALIPCLLLLTCVSASAQTPPEKPLPQEQAAAERTPPASSDAMTSIDPAKKADIRRLQELTSAKARMLQVMQGMETSLRPLMTSALPAGAYRDRLVQLFFERFHSKMDLEALLDTSIPIYDKYFSAEEIKALIKFYETPLGQKTLEVMPKMTPELMNAGKSWGESLGRTSMLEVLNEHPELANALKEAQAAKQPAQ